MALTDKQARFVEEYLIDLNATQAAIRAGYSVKTANEQGSRLLANVSVRARIDERMAELSRRTGVNQERVIRELARIAFVNAAGVINFDDATLLPTATDDDTAAIIGVKVKTIPTPDGNAVEREIKFADKQKALELLGKRYGMWVDRQQVEGAVGVQIIDDIGGDGDAEG
ncbi:terminase small subunit [Heliophilum fasciatum]|uniref:Phage terminase small subunit n=1 Tax=Heliophilum fasciatum TaxID=35700 RepID=A0A4R2RLF8_9FIRM|nr:terminase small subunit [Heliophilum fasciatum]MCW2277745.1 phage terminase small subunit [Heliophilum fasciatum]TCP64760.1 phage terminase small subunit [Heliophilum fasciatum]